MTGTDVIIIGSGMGGATLAAALAPSRARILIHERGERLDHSSAAPDRDLRCRLLAVGLHPDGLPLGVDLDLWLACGRTPLNAFPDNCGGKMDAETVSLAHALRHPNFSLRAAAHIRERHFA